MTELETRAEAETEDFTDELSDEALDRDEGRFGSGGTYFSGPAVRSGQPLGGLGTA